ncbi:MAG: HD domain-containing protein [Bacteroidales bacterium]|nr:HD domain-containing protein [Candidatus Physcousia equi]
MEYIVLSRTNGITSKGSPFITLKMANLQEIANIAVWDVPATQGPTVGQLVSFLNIKDNQGKKSAGANDMLVRQMATPEHPLYHLVPRPTPRHDWDNTIALLLDYCTDQRLKPLIKDFAEKLYLPYSKYPAATSVHHAYPGGLLTHTWQMLHMLSGLYPCLPYAVKMERCILGILFHDYGKVYEYNTEGEAREDMYLLGHIYISAYKLHDELKKVYRNAEGKIAPADDAEINRIVHCVLAHHGQREYGSPVMPCLQEAVVINLLDNLSAKTDAIEGAGHMERVFALDTHVVK